MKRTNDSDFAVKADAENPRSGRIARGRLFLRRHVLRSLTRLGERANRSLLLPLASVPIFLLAGAAFPAEPDAWTLDRCVDAAQKNSFMLDSRRALITGAESALRASEAARWPTLGLAGAYTYTSETQKLNLSAALPGIHMPSVEFGDGNVYDAALTARAPLFTGGTLRQRARADAAALRSAEHDFAADSLQLLWDVRRAYYQTLGAQARADAARHAAERIERHVQDISAAMTAGWQSEEARIAATAALRQTESTRIAADAQARAERLRLGNLVGAPAREIFPGGDLDTPLITDEPAGGTAVESRAEMLALQSRIEQSRRLTRAAQGSLLPALSAMAAYHYGKPGVNVVENDWMDYYAVGVNASWTLWDWNARRYQVHQTRAQMNALDAQRGVLERTLVNREQIALVSLHSAQAALEKFADRVDLERTRLALVEGRWRQGVATESELLDAQDDLTQAETDAISATAAVRLAEADLLYASGH
ncbi:MAG: TolC family protein [bacterium]|nr:TolC family protein [bacterium]